MTHEKEARELGAAIKLVTNMLRRDGTPSRLEAVELLESAYGAALASPPVQAREQAKAEVDERALTAALIQRDLYHDIADELAERIGLITGHDIGEHSSDNDPWLNAKDAADQYIQLLPQTPKPAPAEQAKPSVGGELRMGGRMQVKPDYSDMSKEALERLAARMAQLLDDDRAIEFHRRHAMGSKAMPSCLCCGKLPEEIAIRHMELPNILICKVCRDAALAPPEERQASVPVADMFWWADDPEQFGHDIDELVQDFDVGSIVKIDCAMRLPTVSVKVVEDKEMGDGYVTYEYVASPTTSQGAAPDGVRP